MAAKASKAPKVLNIDDYVPAGAAEKRVISMGGVEHEILETTVENFMLTTQQARKLEETNASMDEQMAATVDMIMRYVPTLPRDQLMKLSMAKLYTIVSFVRGDDLDLAAAAVEHAVAAAEAVENEQGKEGAAGKP